LHAVRTVFEMAAFVRYYRMQLASRPALSYHKRRCKGVTTRLQICILQAPGLNIFWGRDYAFFYIYFSSLGLSTKILGIIPEFDPCNEDKNVLTRKASKPQYQLLAAS